MAALSVNTIKQIMKAMVDSPGFDRVMSKVTWRFFVIVLSFRASFDVSPSRLLH